MSTQPRRRRREENGEPAQRETIATNTGIRLACAMSAMIGLFAIFLCWTEKESRVIRRFSVQSAALTIIHAAVMLCAVVISFLLGGVPYFGIMVTLVCWLIYIAMLIVLVCVRVKLMEHAWHGWKYDLPLIENELHRFY